MNASLVAGTIIVQLALICYTIGTWKLHRRRAVHSSVLTFISLGVAFDIVATIFMITGSPNSPFTPHGLLGYSSLTGMLLDAVLLWRRRLLGAVNPLPRGLLLYSRLAYLWWVAAYITGAALVMARRAA